MSLQHGRFSRGNGGGVAGLSSANGGDAIGDNEVIRGDGTTGIQGSTATLDDTAHLLVGAGDASLPSYSFVGDPNTGMFSEGADIIGFSVGGSRVVNIQGGTSTFYMAGLLLTGGTLRKVEARASGPVSLDNSHSRSLQTNEGASGSITFNLPSAAANYEYFFYVQAAQNIVVDAAAGDTIRIGASVSSSGGTATNGTVGGALHLVAINATEWVAAGSPVGTWTLA